MDKPNNNLFNKIMVRAPYNILNIVSGSNNDYLLAHVSNEYLHRSESGPIGIGEAGRHAAILGSMHIARELNTESSYYLATHGELKRVSDVIHDYKDIYIRTRIADIGKRSAKIKADVLDCNDTTIYQIDVEYIIIRYDVFDKIYKNKKVDKLERHGTPYAERKSINLVKLDNRYRAYYGEIEHFECLGHFDNYPCFPVAISADHYTQGAIEIFKDIYPDYRKNNFIAKHMNIDAFKLIHAGSEMFYDFTLENSDYNNFIVKGICIVHDELAQKCKILISCS